MVGGICDTEIDTGSGRSSATAKAVKDIEALLANSNALRGSTSNTVLTAMLDSTKKRLAEIERDEEEHERQERQKSSNELAIAHKAQRETALNAEEQRQYADFLEKDHFTRADFGKLESFYTNTWERLSEDGKAEMSHRVWEGVRQQEYEFSELPDVVKEKEAQRLYDQLSLSKIYDANLLAIPQQDRDDFKGAWSNGKRQEAFEVLDRSSFAENVAVSAGSVRSGSAEVKTQADASKTLEQAVIKAKEAKPEVGNAAVQADLKLDDLLLADSGDSKPRPPLPELKGNSSKARTP